ncbi:MAG: YlxR family protein [Lachnospiraceae bacterium]|nr:YlxR family protein [Lachnospiraceae bacterium]
MSKRVPVRMCVGCREMREKREMIRVVRLQDGTFCVDETGKRNGRGAYLCKNTECLEKAIRNHGMERSFKMSIPKETVALLKKEMSALAK